MAQAVKLLVVEIDNHNQTFGNTDYVTMITETTDKQQLPVAISHNALKKGGITSALFDDMIGSHIIVKDDTNIQTGEFMEAKDRIQQVLDKTPNRTILLCNGANSSFAKSDFLSAESKEVKNNIEAKVLIEKDKARKLENAKRRAERLANLVNDSEPKAEPQSMLETNEDLGF